MQIKMISKTPDFLTTIWVAARTCYSPLSPVELLEQDPAIDEKLRMVKHILRNKHLSVVEHCHMTFAVKQVSRTLLAQYSRHRIGVSLSVQSQRYVSEQSSKNLEGIFEYVVPPSIEDSEVARNVYTGTMEKIQEAYDSLIELGVRKEDARFVLPGGAGVNLVTSLNLRSFLDVYEKRVHTPGAQWEIREMLIEMGRILVAEEPWLAAYLDKDE